MKSSYDILGSKEKSVAIIEETESPKELAKEIMDEHKNVKSVLMKLSERMGIERKRDYKFIMGDPDTEVIHKENYCRFKLDPQKVYFSGREGTERLRIAEMIKSGERILVMFSGIAPYAIVISKNQPNCEILCVDVNKDAIRYAEENIKLNKMKNIKNYCSDIREFSEKGTFDRILMPLPHDAREYLELACKCLKPEGGMIHLYIIEPENEAEKNVKELMKNFQEKIKGKISYKIKKVLPYSPRTYKYCVDIQINEGN